MAAAMLQEEGYEVIGVTMRVWPPRAGDAHSDGSVDQRGLDAVSAAARIARRLDIPHQVVDLRDIFSEKVVADFCREYSMGTMATGHYARIDREQSTRRYLLLKGVDRSKDQSYFLAMLRQEQLERIVMPLGCLTKAVVEQRARERGLASERQKESQEICFIPDGDYGGFLKGCTPEAFRPGPVLDSEGNVLGQHHGLPLYTVGQRKGFGISSPDPLYVTDIDAQRNAVIVGSKDDACSDELIASRVSWVSAEAPQHPLDLKAKIRYRHREADAVVTPVPREESVHVKFKQPQTAVTPGQAVVFYDGDVVIGGGTIEQVL